MWTAATASQSFSRALNTSALNRPRKSFTVADRFAGSALNGTVDCVADGVTAKPPFALIRALSAVPPIAAATPAAASARSYQATASGCRRSASRANDRAPAHDHQRRHPDQQHQRVAHQGPAQHRRHQHRDPPAAPGAVEDQQGEQDGDGRAGVVGIVEQQGDGEQGRADHDGDGDHGPDHGRAVISVISVVSRPRAVGHRRRQHHQQRVGERGADPHHVRVQPADQLDQHVLGQLGRVERHVGQLPAVQQQVAVQHRPALEHHPGAVGRRAQLRAPRAARSRTAAPPRPPPPPTASPGRSRQVRRGRCSSPPPASVAPAGPLTPASMTGSLT